MVVNMLKTLQNENEIKKAQKDLENVLKKITNKRSLVKIGYKGGSREEDVSYSKMYNMWFCLGEELEGDSGKKRYWNVFGLNEPKEKSNNSIIVEINPPLEGIYRRVAGVFAKDNKNRIFLLHRGRIGGGRKGIGQKSFYKYYSGKKSFTQEDDKQKALIGCITSPDFPKRLNNFVVEVNKIKKIVHPR